jgi:hypothetical protein
MFYRIQERVGGDVKLINLSLCLSPLSSHAMTFLYQLLCYTNFILINISICPYYTFCILYFIVYSLYTVYIYGELNLWYIKSISTCNNNCYFACSLYDDSWKNVYNLFIKYGFKHKVFLMYCFKIFYFQRLSTYLWKVSGLRSD